MKDSSGAAANRPRPAQAAWASVKPILGQENRRVRRGVWTETGVLMVTPHNKNSVESGLIIATNVGECKAFPHVLIKPS